MDWDKLRVFYTVATAGNFTKAVDFLNISQSAISRQVNILEQDLGEKLFTRVSRGLILTKTGEDLKKSIGQVYAKLATVEANMEDHKNKPRGSLQIAASIGYGTYWLAPLVQEFIKKYPNVHMSLLLKDEDVNLFTREADIAITTTKPKNADLLYREVTPYPFRIYAGRTYLKKNGIPKTIEDLDNHRLITFGKNLHPINNDLTWLLTLGAKKKRKPYLSINNIEAIYDCVKSGLGISAFNRYVVKDDPELEEILPGSSPASLSQYIVYPSYLGKIKRAQLFIDFLESQMDQV